MSNPLKIDGFAQYINDSEKVDVMDFLTKPSRGGSILNLKEGGKAIKEFGSTNIKDAKAFLSTLVKEEKDPNKDKKLDVILRLLGVDTSKIEYSKTAKTRMNQKEGHIVGLVALANKAVAPTQRGDIKLTTAMQKLTSTAKVFIDKVLESKETLDAFNAMESTDLSDIYGSIAETGLTAGTNWAAKSGVQSQLALDVKKVNEESKKAAKLSSMQYLIKLSGLGTEEPKKEELKKEKEPAKEPTSEEVSGLIEEFRQPTELTATSVEDLDDIIDHAMRVTEAQRAAYMQVARFGDPDYSEAIIAATASQSIGTKPSSFGATMRAGTSNQQPMGWGDPVKQPPPPPGAPPRRETRWTFYDQGNADNIPPVAPMEQVDAATQAAIGDFATKGTITDENSLLIAAQVARQNLLLKSNAIAKNQNKVGKQFKKRELTFEEYMQIVEARELEALKLNVDMAAADARNEQMQEAQRHIDQQVRANELWGVPLVN